MVRIRNEFNSRRNSKRRIFEIVQFQQLRFFGKRVVELNIEEEKKKWNLFVSIYLYVSSINNSNHNLASLAQI